MAETQGNALGRSKRRGAGIYLLVFVAALTVRAGYGLIAAPTGDGTSSLTYDDERWYWAMARSMRSGDGMVGEFGHRAERMPVYPAFLALFAATDGGIVAARAGQWAIGALAACLVFALGDGVCGRRGAWIAATVVVFDPTLVGSASLLLSETLFVTFAAWLWMTALPLRRRGAGSVLRWVLAGVAAAGCVYTRESSLLMVGGLCVFLALSRRDRSGAVGAAGIILFVAVTLVPWAYRNSRVIGEWCWLTTRAGISLYDGVHPGATGEGDLARIKDLPAVQGRSEAQWNDFFLRRSFEAIADNPLRILRLAPVKLARTWSPVLNAPQHRSRGVRLVFAMWYIPLYVLTLLGVWSRRGEWALLIGLLLPAMCLSLIHSIYVGSVRYRLGALPTLAVLAAIGLIEASARRRSARTRDGGDQ